MFKFESNTNPVYSIKLGPVVVNARQNKFQSKSMQVKADTSQSRCWSKWMPVKMGNGQKLPWTKTPYDINSRVKNSMGQNPLEGRTKTPFNGYSQNVGHTKHLLFELAGISSNT